MSTLSPPLTACVSNANLQLTDLERQLIANFRAMESDIRSDVIAITAEFVRTMPAKPTQLYLVRKLG